MDSGSGQVENCTAALQKGYIRAPRAAFSGCVDTSLCGEWKREAACVGLYIPTFGSGVGFGKAEVPVSAAFIPKALFGVDFMGTWAEIHCSVE